MFRFVAVLAVLAVAAHGKQRINDIPPSVLK